MNTGDKILKLMNEEKVSRTELSKALNINYQTLCKYIQNKRTIPKDVLINIANYFNVTLDYLLNRNEIYMLNDTELANEINKLNENDKKLVKNIVKIQDLNISYIS